MNPFAFAVLASACVFSAQRARAADLPVPYNHVEYKQVGNTYSWTPLNGPTPGGGGVVFRGDTTISTADPKISTTQKLPFDKRGDVPDFQKAKVTSPFTKAAFSKAVVSGAKLGALAVGGAIPGLILAYAIDLGIKNLRLEDDDLVGEQPIEGGGFVWYAADGAKHSTAQSACVASWNGNGYFVYLKQVGGGNMFSCYFRANGSMTENAYANVVRGAVTEVVMTRMSETEIADKIAQQSGWPTSAALALQSALKVPGVTLETEPPGVSGPSSVPGPKTTTTSNTQVAPGTTNQVPAGTPDSQPATVTTTTNTTNNAVYNNNKVTHSTTTSTVVNITNNVTNQTDTTTEKEESKEDDQEDETPTDTPLGDIPKLYERKYPDGMSGIWSAKSAEIRQLPLFTLADQLMPTGLTGGTCPAWKIDLGFGHSFGEYGLQDVSPPCWIWDVAKLIIIASSLILARALVFGG